MRDEDPLEAALRESLRVNARRAPDADDVTDRILAAADGPTLLHDPHRPGRGRWRTWGLPLVAAASVAAVVGGVLTLSHLDVGSDRDAAATSGPSPSPSVSRPAPVVVPSPSSAFSVSPSSGAATSVPADTSTLHGVRIVDLTFTGTDTGWALASAKCIRTAGRCPALLHTDDGHTWDSRPGTPFTVPGDSGPGDRGPEVDHLRFATDDIGYAYGPDAFFMTTNGAQSWQRMSGGADALETLDGNVIRVSDSGGCPPGCRYTVQTAAIGGSEWSTIDLPGNSTGDAVSLSRGGAEAYLLVSRNPAAGAGAQTSSLYRSADDGASWRGGGEPCPRRAGGEVDSVAVAAGAPGDVSVLCSARGTYVPASVATSSDSGASFHRQGGRLPPLASGPNVLAGDPSTVLAVAALSGLSRSVDGGDSWHRARDVSTAVGFVGFESQTVGRAVSTDGRTIWTTRDAGRTWKSVTFG